MWGRLVNESSGSEFEVLLFDGPLPLVGLPRFADRQPRVLPIMTGAPNEHC